MLRFAFCVCLCVLEARQVSKFSGLLSHRPQRCLFYDTDNSFGMLGGGCGTGERAELVIKTLTVP